MIRKHTEFNWDGAEVYPYKEDSSLFKGVTRQTLFPGANDLEVELRYFEIEAEGHSTLERHHHSHLVTVIRGSGRVLVGTEIHEVGLHDVIEVPPLTWHQFRATCTEPLGFLCVVSRDRDRPQRPTPAEVEALCADERVASFVRV
jgi:mannose-6-phosphate isomerase-like protein (cupin superfamily)